MSARNAGNTADFSLIKLNASDQIEFGTDVVFGGSLLPTTNDTFDLGSDALRWRDLYLGPATLHIGTSTTDGGAITFDTTADELEFGLDGTQRLLISDTGNVVVGTAALATSAATGFFYQPSMAGTPTGIPTTYTGRVPTTYDSTNNILYAYNGGAWQQLTSMSAGSVVLGEVSAPSATANQGKLYVKSIAGGNSLFFKDENGVETDLINNTGKLTTAEPLRTIRGSVAANGTITAGSGFTVTHTASSGIYQINFNTAFSVAPTTTTGNAYIPAAGRLSFASSYTPTTTTVQIRTTRWEGASPGGTEFTLTDDAFDFIITGTP